MQNFVRYLAITLIGVAAISCGIGDKTAEFPTNVMTFAGRNGELGEPFGIAVRDGLVFVSDGEKDCIWKIGAKGEAAVFAAGLHTPSQIAFLPDGKLIVADTGSNTIRSVDASGAVTIIAGVENEAGDNDGTSTEARFRAPIGVATDAEGRIFVADTYNDRIRVIENGTVRTFAGSTRGFGDGAVAQFDTPSGLAVWKDLVLVADTGNGRIRAVEKGGGVWTLAGGGSETASNSTLSAAAFYRPVGVAVGPNDELFVADRSTLRYIGGVIPRIRTLNTPRRGFRDGKLSEAHFNRISGLAVDGKGRIFVADSDNRVVRVVETEPSKPPISAEDAAKLEYPSGASQGLEPESPRWPYDPPEQKRDIAGTFGEIRGKVTGEATDEVHFHTGLDIAGGYGETARLVRSEKALEPIAADNFGTLRELVRLPQLGYIHLRLGRNANGTTFGDTRFLFSSGADGKLNGVRIPRGTKFAAGEAIGTLNPMNHVHLVAGRSGYETNALDTLILPNVSDGIAPVIENVHLSIDGKEIETNARVGRIQLAGKTRLTAEAYDRMDGNPDRRKLGLYKIGWQLLKSDLTPKADIDWTVKFDLLPPPDSVPFVYAKDSYSGATGITRFIYIVSNRVHGELIQENVIDLSALEPGKWVIRVVAADRFGNTTAKDIPFEVD
ncbi:MAG TPA: hypothetical protein PLR83_09680 [Pyrinomonadaceae bacterium]|nr:hypothetical protein [Pyrinomonadaceae bacterium]